ncbi:uncharacterized protein C2orf72 homolog [Spea bombifrons]|uniref:uncharacterized protein C2orf72 homolog n=1 Tax=Spea bombifrons TaxID=233779 RepID=UPI00234915E2|nr:uncharacterized protein C2orf72 homolog [Spea bombifrons]
MARDCTERQFQEVLERCGGADKVLLVGEMWQRVESRALLEGFLRTLFPKEQEDGAPHCVVPQEKEPGVAAAQRSRRFCLVFFLCRAESLRLRESQRRLKEILRDVKDRTPGGGAVIGVIVQPDGAGETAEEEEGTPEEQKLGGPAGCLASLSHDVSLLLALLGSVFTPGRGRWPEVRAAALLQGQEESRREVQRLACEALSAAADLQKTLKQKPLLHCFPWCRRRTKKDHVLKVTENPEEGTALTVLNYPNGDYSKNSSDA